MPTVASWPTSIGQDRRHKVEISVRTGDAAVDGEVVLVILDLAMLGNPPFYCRKDKAASLRCVAYPFLSRRKVSRAKLHDL
jgi:hypothetical protein